MKIVFLTIVKINDISDRGVYPDLLRKFRKEGHTICIITPLERRDTGRTGICKGPNLTILKVKTLNIQKTNLFEKLLGIVLINFQYIRAIKRYLRDEHFDLILYSTPPVTLLRVVKYLKNKKKASTYLLLKDIFPQNAVDLGLIGKNSLLHKYFLTKEKRLYMTSDHIGCMSEANADYILKSNPDLDSSKVEVNPNSHEFFNECISREEKMEIRRKYNIPANAVLFTYGGNLGKPQGIGFVIDLLYALKERTGIFILIAGEGTEYKRIKSWSDENKPSNFLLLQKLSKSDYNKLLQSSDVGMIFLDKRFTVPNFPSRLLSYLEYKLPVLASTDSITDLGKIICENNFGLWSEAGDIESTILNITKLSVDHDLRRDMGYNGFNYFLNNFTVDQSYEIIMNHFTQNN
jgi:hypothetical protein